MKQCKPTSPTGTEDDDPLTIVRLVAPICVRVAARSRESPGLADRCESARCWAQTPSSELSRQPKDLLHVGACGGQPVHLVNCLVVETSKQPAMVGISNATVAMAVKGRTMSRS